MYVHNTPLCIEHYASFMEGAPLVDHRALHLSTVSMDIEYVSTVSHCNTLFFGIPSELDSWFSLLWPGRKHSVITYDGSQSTLWDSNFFYKGQEYCVMPAVISRVLPNAKFIIVMRNPVTSLYSQLTT